MRRKVRSSSARGAANERRDAGEPESVDSLAAEVVERVVRVLVRRGVTRPTIERSLSRAWRRIPRSAYVSGVGTQRELIDISHVLTVWFVDPLYVDANGEPLHLSVAGPAPSLATLVQHVDPKLEVEQVLEFLLKFDAVRMVGSRYAPRSRALALRGTGAPTHAHSLRGLLGMLRTLEHNVEPKSKAPTRFEYVAENPRFPVSGREKLDAALNAEAMRLLRDFDSRMLTEERKAKPGEPTVRIGLGVYRYEEESPPVRGRSTQGRPKRRRARKAKRRGKG
ncbi:MAG: DUF6502 family protein [Steroidobacteraceae bacterium]